MQWKSLDLDKVTLIEFVQHRENLKEDENCSRGGTR